MGDAPQQPRREPSVFQLIPTERIAAINGQPCRAWEALSTLGTRAIVWVAMVQCDPADTPRLQAEFGPRIFEMVPPRADSLRWERNRN